VLRPVLPDHVKVPLIIAYWTGMRTGEVLRLQWNQLDLERGLLRLEPGTTKNNQGGLVPLSKEVVEALWQWKQATLRRYPTCVWVCHYRGERLVSNEILRHGRLATQQNLSHL
jgi:integrase